MQSCTVEHWTLADLANALQDMHKDNKRIAVPIFQRGKRWKRSQQHTFIDSLLKGFPVGTMLFHEEKDDEGKRTYILIDGLQRGNCIKKYMNNPTEFFYDSSISDEFCKSILIKLNEDKEDNYSIVRNLLVSFIKAQKTFKNLQYYEPARQIQEEFNADHKIIGELIDVIGEFFNERQALYEQISMTVIPVVIYHGSEDNLPEIFDRINSQGTPLDQYEVYAASWPVNQRITISNIDIVETAIRKYDSFVEDGFVIQGYNRERMRSTKQLNAFEYLFGLSKYLVNKYDMLAFQRNLPDDTVNTLGFELVNACLNDTDKIKFLYKNIYDIENIDNFEQALYQAIEFVVNAISPIFKFKGNNRKFGSKVFHSKFQILSMISTSFKEMFKDGNFTTISEDWASKRDRIARNLRLYYVYDILIKYWSEGGNQKIHNVAKPNRYDTDIPLRAWRTALDSFFDKSMSRTEKKNIPNPKSEEIVMLNCIYLNTFTALDQLSIDKFDIEHIAPKEQMKKLLKKTAGLGLPISCIANLCYLPEYVNRSKGSKNFYQDKNYLKHINLTEVEEKYSFTTKEDLEWMDMPFGKEDFDVLKDYYTEFLNNRFETLKKLFCQSMGLNYEEMQNIVIETPEPVSNVGVATPKTPSSPAILRLQEKLGKDISQLKRSTYTSDDGHIGYVLCESKRYNQGERAKYWYGFRHKPFELIENCDEKYIIYAFKDSPDLLLIPYEDMTKLIPQLISSEDTDNEGEISHWHIVFFRDTEGHYTQLLSKPEIQEIDMDEYKV